MMKVIGIDTGWHLSGLSESLAKKFTPSRNGRFMAHPRESSWLLR
jgi:hypothetical protein